MSASAPSPPHSPRSLASSNSTSSPTRATPAAQAFANLDLDYIYTTQGGTRFDIDADTGRITDIRDRVGNRLEIDAAGVRSISPAGTLIEEVAHERDQQGRIVAITDPAGEKITYQYDAAGDLVAVTDRAGNTTSLVYDATRVGGRSHILTDMDNALGTRIMSLAYQPVVEGGLGGEACDRDAIEGVGR